MDRKQLVGKHCGEEHHSRAKAMKRIFWPAEKLKAIFLLGYFRLVADNGKS